MALSAVDKEWFWRSTSWTFGDTEDLRILFAGSKPLASVYSFSSALGFDVRFSDVSCSDEVVSPLFWFKFTSRATDEAIQLSLCNSETTFDTMLFLFSACSANNCLLSDNDGCSGGKSFIDFYRVQSKHDLNWIAVGSSAPSVFGNFKLVLSQYLLR